MSDRFTYPCFNQQPNLPNFRWFIPAVILFILLIMISLVRADNCFRYSDEQIAEAIRKAENSQKYPYGVKSVKTGGNIALAKKVCLNSIRNTRKRYLSSQWAGDFIEFLGLRYAPPKQNPNWVRNVHYFLKEKR